LGAESVPGELRRLRMEIERLTQRIPAPGLACPTLAEFFPRLIEQDAKANRRKPRGIESTRSIFNRYLLPMLGAKPLDAIDTADIQRVKASLGHLSAKTVNNVLSVLNHSLKVAARWGLLEGAPVSVPFLKTDMPEMDFYDFDEYQKLSAAAAAIDGRTLALVFLGGDAGLRKGEMRGLEWPDVDWKRGELSIRRSHSKGHVTKPKSGKGRRVPTTQRLLGALEAIRHQQSERVLIDDGGAPVTEHRLVTWLLVAQRSAALRGNGALHILRHTFCSHLATRGAPLLAIKELAGHAGVETTLRYMHLSPSEARRAISLLDPGKKNGQGRKHS